MSALINDGLGVELYRKIVLEIILKGQHVSQKVYQLRLSLFVRASNYLFNHVQCENDRIEPFPWFFYDPVKKERKYSDLKQHILNIPTLSNFTELTSLPELTWQLLHWIFTNPLIIEVVDESELSDFYTNDLRETTKLANIPYPSKFCTRYDITHPISERKIFTARKKQFGSFFAYHGSPPHNFHSIIHRGLICALNKVGVYGFGTYLTTDLTTATSYSKKYFRTSQDWFRQNENLRNLSESSYCIAIVEIVKDPSVKVFNLANLECDGNNETPNFDYVPGQTKYFVVNNDDLMRLRHLLVLL